MNYIIENETVYKIEKIGNAEIKSCFGAEKQLILTFETETEKVYEWQKFAPDKGEYIAYEECTETAEIEGKEYRAENGKIVVIKELSKSEVKVKELEGMLNSLGKQLSKEKIESIKKDKTILELGKHESKLSMDLMRMKNEVNAIKQALEKDKKGGE